MNKNGLSIARETSASSQKRLQDSRARRARLAQIRNAQTPLTKPARFGQTHFERGNPETEGGELSDNSDQL